ncbi:MAG: DNA gyrase subunit A [Chloroflexi bacterium]|nr:DNA gyrase subunit A [Chloroflexota bacterium]MCH8877132.1 DNA gyrase subunit A [Chloroflexota bacterium]MCI0772347.1 DNA gyrase subunit A [Chloroflexota bacterium]MCI0806404.1 DNA gyrase subunit A [Chloroflexota bacterium]MCI0827493.1 DNA gyrase subunit A [Chloroflexota bacterium]
MEIGTVRQVDIDEEMRVAYLDYAMSVIVSRALPDACDGLKPVQRRILYAMREMGSRTKSPYRKSARIVGEVMGKFHPHGDATIYEAMARMAQDFSLRYPLVDGQGNFGSIDGDPPAAMRYTEARLGAMAEELLVDIELNTVDFVDNFDTSLQEPTVLPARLPNLLLNGASGIAVGMATNIPPHNLGELTAAIIYLVDNYEKMDEVTVDDLMKFIQGPDFPTGGMIIGSEGILQAYSTGKGRIVVRGIANIEETTLNRHRIVITEIPFQVNKTTLIERIAELVRSGKLDGISDLRDESDRRGLSVVLELKRGAQPKAVLNQLFKFTQLQTTFGVQLLALIGGEPRLLSLKRALQTYIEHRKAVITRRSEYELKKARARAHVLGGLLIALANLDAVIDTIRKSANADAAKKNLMKRFELSDIQAQAILELQLRRLAALERKNIQQEAKEVEQRIGYLEDLLGHAQKVLALIKQDLIEVTKKYGDLRRTRIAPDASEEFSEADLVPDEAVLISITQRGYVKRVPAKTYRRQGRGGRGVKGHGTKGEDEVDMLLPAGTLDTVLFFSDRGKVYSEKAYQIPDAGRTARGIPMVNILNLEQGEVITAAVPVPDFRAANYCTMATRGGKIKRVKLSEFAAVRPSGLIAMGLAKGDVLGWVRLTSGKDDIILVTEKGQALRYSEKLVRSMGRPAAGVKAIKLRKDDRVTGMDAVDPKGDLLVVMKKGYGKRTPMKEYARKGRGTMGVVTLSRSKFNVTGAIAAARVVNQKDDLTIISTGGIVLRTKVNQIKLAGRATMGVRLINLKKGETVASVARIAAKDLEKAGVKA